MRILTLAVLAAATAATAAQAAAACKATPPQPAAAPSPLIAFRAQRLDQLPDARSIRAVVRTVDGCQYLDVLRERVSTASPLDARGGWVLAPEHGVVPARKP